ncbi:MAG: rod shape-determining protein MreD [Sulfitobacter sp.]|nr:rod shape-determining protein MreD [Sulfitobacter sp.]
MKELTSARLWIMRAAFLALTLVILFFSLLPLETTPRAWAGPDLLLCFACAWSIRRPEYVPALSIAFAFLLTDFLLQRPPGLLALLALLGCENLKSRGRTLRDTSFPAEWFAVAVVILFVLIGARVILALAMVDVPNQSLVLTELGLTILAYPLVVGITHFLMGVRRSAPGDLDARGQRI